MRSGRTPSTTPRPARGATPRRWTFRSSRGRPITTPSPTAPASLLPNGNVLVDGEPDDHHRPLQHAKPLLRVRRHQPVGGDRLAQRRGLHRLSGAHAAAALGARAAHRLQPEAPPGRDAVPQRRRPAGRVAARRSPRRPTRSWPATPMRSPDACSTASPKAPPTATTRRCRPTIRWCGSATSDRARLLRAHPRPQPHGRAAGRQPEIVTTQFDVPAGLEAGPTELVVVTNGIPSHAIVVNGPDLTVDKIPRAVPLHAR